MVKLTQRQRKLSLWQLSRLQRPMRPISILVFVCYCTVSFFPLVAFLRYHVIFTLVAPASSGLFLSSTSSLLLRFSTHALPRVVFTLVALVRCVRVACFIFQCTDIIKASPPPKPCTGIPFSSITFLFLITVNSYASGTGELSVLLS